MEGPTPVSALIHAATMVTAGVFLFLRLSNLYIYLSNLLIFIVIIGILTTIFAGTVALVQNDIKKVIAYSTCSQLGYMITACGLGFYSGAFFHLICHALFKALLFLGAGSIIHSLADEQDIRRMGGLALTLPITFFTFFLASANLMGFPFTSGFYSKDLLLEMFFSHTSAIGFFAYF
jgi:NADH:ubiquinone oxidoreductase subunit 5 (subunit L)/multisubunit Na+/H+ antiporter MnhA subunit